MLNFIPNEVIPKLGADSNVYQQYLDSEKLRPDHVKEKKYDN